ncbi:hypothetical protein [Actinomadura oligospora]|uniref:hypothetical protein n=1 Tax=Actinomadura oligospora TaxID=111804 RepID=UPI000478FD13|nr:hypothetical protein [Actinomadura oligospora]
MKQSVRKALLGAAVASSVIALTTAPAQATGQGVTTSHPITLTGSATWKSTTTGGTISCTKSTGTGIAQDPPNAFVQINSMAFSSPANPNGWCTGPGILMQVTASGFPWTLSPTGVTVGGVTPVSVTGIKASLVGSDNCHATITGPAGGGGTVTGKYTSGTASLTLGGVGSTSNLTVQTADINCDPGLINVGDSITMNASYTVSPPLVF